MPVSPLPLPADRSDRRARTAEPPRSLPALALLALIAVTPSTLVAGAGEEPESATVATSAAPTDAASSPAAAGWRVYRDPETGRLLSAPLPGQAEALSAKWARRRAQSTPAGSPRTFPIVLQGQTVGTGVALEGRFVTSTVLRILPDGSSVVECFDGQDAHQDSPTSPPQAHPER